MVDNKGMTRSKTYTATMVEAWTRLLPETGMGVVVGGGEMTVYSRLLAHGAEMREIDRKESLRLRALHDLKSKQCYYNAQLMAITYPELTYCEGVGSTFFATDHAWLIDKSGSVIDPTWIVPDMVNRSLDYFGVAIPTKQIRKIYLGTDGGGSLLPHFFGLVNKGKRRTA